MRPLDRRIYPDDVTEDAVLQGIADFFDDASNRFHCEIESLEQVMRQIAEERSKHQLVQANRNEMPLDEQLILTLSNGYTLRSGGDEYELGAYVRICDKHGREVVYWAPPEWEEAPEEVMGAILGAIIHPERCAALARERDMQTRQEERAPRAGDKTSHEEANGTAVGGSPGAVGSVRAYVCPDGCPGVEFDVTRWLNEAEDPALGELRALSYGGNYLSDGVARDVREYDSSVDAVMTYCEATGSGFTCALPIDATEAWIKQCRPHIGPPEDDGERSKWPQSGREIDKPLD